MSATFMNNVWTATILQHIDDSQYESYTTALWNNILTTYMPMNTKDGFLYNHEYYTNDEGEALQGFADIAVLQIFKNSKNQIVQVPFIMVELKKPTKFESAPWKVALKQVQDRMAGVANQFGKLGAYPLHGIVGAGGSCCFLEWNWDTMEAEPLTWNGAAVLNVLISVNEPEIDQTLKYYASKPPSDYTKW